MIGRISLRSAAEVRKLGATSAEGAIQAELTGVVTFVHGAERTFFLSDATGGVAVSVPDQGLPLPSPADSVTLTATTVPGPVFPTLQASAIRVNGKGSLPLPREITSESGLTAEDYAQWVEILARLHAIDRLAGWLRLTLDTPSGDFSVSIPTAQLPRLAVGEQVRVRGVCSAWLADATLKLGGFFLYTPSLADIEPAESDGSVAQTLTRVSQIQGLRADEARSGRAVQLRGVVTFSHPDQRIFFLDDATGGVLVWLADPALKLPTAGTTVSLGGHTGAGVFTARVQGESLAAGAPAPWPAPRAISLEQAVSGAADHQWVELRGHLRQVITGSGWLRLTLSASTGEFTVSIPQADRLEAKVGSLVTVRGVCQTWLDETGRIGGAYLYTPGTDQIEVIAPPPENPFAGPEETIDNLARYRTELLQQQPVVIHGTVLHQMPGHYVIVGNTSGVVRALTRELTPLRPGDLVAVAGVPGRQGNRAVLRGAVYRRTGAGPAPIPLQPATGLTLDPALEGRLVAAAGSVVSTSWRPADTRLLVRSGPSTLEVIYTGALPAAIAARWAPGSTIAVTALYAVEYDEEERPVKFSLQLRTPDDLRILANPSWWTVGRALTGLSLFGGCLALGLIWVAALRRQVRRQTVTIRRQWETEANLRARHSEIIARASDLIFTTDLAGRFTSFSPAGERITGYTAAEALGMSLFDLIDPPDAAVGPALLALAHAPETGTTPHFEMHFRTRDGRKVWVETSVRKIPETGAPAGLLGVARDVTERKRAELERAKLEDLKHQLLKSESLGRMAAAVAHHFNNQLQAVMMSLDLAMNDHAPRADQRNSLSIALQSTRKAAEVSTLMLTYLGSSHLQRTSLDLSAVCRQDLARLRATLPPGTVLECVLPSPGPMISANLAQVQQVIAHLVTNAGEACRETRGGIRLSLTTVPGADIPSVHRYPVDRQPSGAGHACLEIADTGSGIAAPDIAKIFDPFFTRKFPGRGMGLAVVLGIVRDHDGAITVESRPGSGSVFRVFLPVLT